MTDIDLARMSDEALNAYDDMMIESTVKIERFAPLASLIWSAVLKELGRRGKVRLISGSYDDIGNALIQRVDR